MCIYRFVKLVTFSPASYYRFLNSIQKLICVLGIIKSAGLELSDNIFLCLLVLSFDLYT